MSYAEAKRGFAKIGVDTEKVIKELKAIPISMHCWQGDDITGFETTPGASGGIRTTGNYPGKATTPQELMDDIDFAMSLIPGRHRLNLHACYGIHEQTETDRDKLEPANFRPWVEWAKKRGIGLDFNPTFFSHPNAADGLTLSHPDPKIRTFWVNHGVRSIRIAEYFAKELNSPCTVNFWMPDGYKDEPADRLGPRQRMADSLDRIFRAKYNRKLIVPTLESKLFGIGVESYTVASHEFVMGYAMKHGILALLDMGHFHNSENVADKISSFLMAFGRVAFHISRPVRWDSDHVIRQNDDLRGAAQEIVKMGPKNFIIALDYFDASINRIAAWVLGMRNMQKELLKAMLQPNAALKRLQDERRFTELLVMQEELKGYPWADVWAEFCRRERKPSDEGWLVSVGKYERDVLSLRA